MKALTRGLQRRAASRQARKKFIIVSEGAVTEAKYFEHLAEAFRDTLIEIEVVSGVGSPRTVADRAIFLKRQAEAELRNGGQSYATHDEYWAVFDRDDFTKFREAIEICRDASVGAAYSNPCFELWLILHFCEYDRPCKTSDVVAYLRSIHPAYDPKKKKKFVDGVHLFPTIAQAERRAERQRQSRVQERNIYGAPSTAVSCLTKAIREAANPRDRKNRR